MGPGAHRNPPKPSTTQSLGKSQDRPRPKRLKSKMFEGLPAARRTCQEVSASAPPPLQTAEHQNESLPPDQEDFFEFDGATESDPATTAKKKSEFTFKPPRKHPQLKNTLK